MRLLKTIPPKKNIKQEDLNKFRVRKAARAVVFDADKNIGLLHVSNHNYHILPGGGVDQGEGKLEALKRECLDEIGCNIEVTGELGEIVEYRDKWSIKQQSWCYIADVVGKKGKPDFTQKELDSGFKIKWVKFSEAIKILKADKPDNYEGQCIQIRDLKFLKEAKEQLNI